MIRSAAVLFIPHHPAPHSVLKTNLGVKCLKKVQIFKDMLMHFTCEGVQERFLMSKKSKKIHITDVFQLYSVLWLRS